MTRYILLSSLFLLCFSLSAFTQPASHSVLSEGHWYKLGVTKDGVYKVTYEDLLSWGVIGGKISSSSIRLMGRGGGMLPERVSEFRHDDLAENAISVIDDGAGNFGPGSYFLFYGQAPDTWKWNSVNQKYIFSKHLYSDSTYYFLSVQGNNGLRIAARPSEIQSPAYTTNAGDERIRYEQELYNLFKSGRKWLGRNIAFSNSWDTTFRMSGHVPGEPASLEVRIAGRCIGCTTRIFLYVNDVITDTLVSYLVPNAYRYTFANEDVSVKQVWPAADGSIKVKLVLDAASFQANGDNGAWIDYIDIQGRQPLVRNSGGQMLFRDHRASGITEYHVLQSQGTVWDITDPIRPVWQQGTQSGGEWIFRTPALAGQEFVAFDHTFFTPVFRGYVPPQDLHALTGDQHVDLLIITASELLPAAEELADIHVMKDGMNVHVVTIDKIYNEYSSGMQDITAIRDFIRMYREKAGGNDNPKYVCLFGAASYEYKTHLNRIGHPNTNLVPTYQSADSYGTQGNSYGSDDYYAWLDSNDVALVGHLPEGKCTTQTQKFCLDVGIGRLPVRSLTEAREMVGKIRNYTENAECLRDWKNYVTLVADDMDESWEDDFVLYNEAVAAQINQNQPVYNLDKIYIDSYRQVSNAGQRYPDANFALNSRFNKGALIIYYLGHGGESGWASERILDYPDIEIWENANALPMIVTITCTFTRYDNPEYASAGELVLLRPDRGSIAMISTSRAINALLDYSKNVMGALLTEELNGEMLRLGDVIRRSKDQTNYGLEANILLFGDPALRLAYPQFRVVTDSINGIPAGQLSVTDTLHASQDVVITGHIEDDAGNLLPGFDGIVYTTIFDKIEKKHTLQNDPPAKKLNFNVQNSVLFKGQNTVKNGRFETRFKMPLDINYTFGEGRISYYAQNGFTDAHGYDNKIAVGGSVDNCYSDVTGPELQLFLGDTDFRDGGITDATPVLYIQVTDASGVTLTGSGMGHHFTVQVDNDPSLVYVLNDYFLYDVDSYTSGMARFPLPVLAPGFHSITVKAFDGCNNMSSASLSFAVTNTQTAMIRLYNYPNPFMTSTRFTFEHNRDNQWVNASMEIFDMEGRLVKNLATGLKTNGFRVDGLEWDGTNNGGVRMRSGVYICKIRLTDSEGKWDDAQCKVVLVN